MPAHPFHEPRAIGSLLREPATAFQRGIIAAVAVAYPDLRFAHMGIIIHIDHPPDGTRLTELAERMQITKQSLGEMVDYLEPRGYVERLPDPLDRRAKLLRLTERGWQVHEECNDIALRLQATWARCLGEDRMIQLLALLADLGRCIEADLDQIASAALGVPSPT